MKLVFALVLVLVLVGRAASADPSTDPPPDPAATRAGDANLESTAHRQGITLSAAIGPSFTLGSGAVGTGTGGAVALRLGHVATPSTVIQIEVQGGAQFHKNGTDGSLIANNATNLLVGVQYWVGPSLWIRAMGGIGGFKGNQVQLDNGRIGDIKLLGPSGGAGAGIDLARWRGIVLGLEIYSVNMLNRDGLLSTNALSLDISLD